MAMPPGNAVSGDKIQYPVAGAGEMYGRQQWFPDERDGFISWLRAEFAAANAMIDSLCHHLRSSGEPGEYDGVINSIQHRRCNWTPVILMQQYISVAEVTNALHHVAWRRQQRSVELGKAGARDYKRSWSGFRQGHNTVSAARGRDSNERGGLKQDDAKSSGHVGKKMDDSGSRISLDGKDVPAKPHGDISFKNLVKAEASRVGNNENQMGLVNDSSTSGLKEKHATMQNHNEMQSQTSLPKTFVAEETNDGNSVNVVEGLKVFDELFDGKEVSDLISLINDLRGAAKKGQLQGQAYVVSKRPMKGRGREVIQLGLPVADARGDSENALGSSIEPIPRLLEDIIEQLVTTGITSVKPDSCVIDFYNEGDHSQPHVCPSWFARPICIMCLSECDMTFGRTIIAEQPGNYKGSLKLNLAPGSLIVMQGKAADLAKHAIDSIKKQRILVSFIKSQPRKPAAFPAPPSLPSQWGPASRPGNHARHPPGLKNHYSGGVLPAPQLHPQVPNPSCVQPIFMTTPAVPPLPFPAPVSVPAGPTSWPAASGPRHPSLYVALPGTGVFFPPQGPSNSSERDNGPNTPEISKSASPGGKTEEKRQEPGSNGGVDGKLKEEEQQGVEGQANGVASSRD